MVNDLPETKPAVYIGLDQSYSGFGFVTLYDDRPDDVILWNFTKNKGGDSERLLIIYDMLVHAFWTLQKHFTCHIAMEGYAHGSRFNREKMGELGGIVKLAVYDAFGKEPFIIAPTVVKKFVTGKGVATKEQMVAGVEAKWQAGITDHNIADAYGIAQYLKSQYV
jgi:Holliday junction resolvasome RuvABC endonuclease subunit